MLIRITVNLCQQLNLQRLQPQMVNSLDRFLQGLRALNHPQRSLIVLMVTAIGWGLNAMTYWTGLLAFGIHTPGFLGALFTQSATALAIALPSTPGYVGPFEAGIRFALGLYGISSDVTIAYALVLRVLMYVTIPCIALIVVARLGWSRGELVSLSKIKSGSKRPPPG